MKQITSYHAPARSRGFEQSTVMIEERPTGLTLETGSQIKARGHANLKRSLRGLRSFLLLSGSLLLFLNACDSSPPPPPAPPIEAKPAEPPPRKKTYDELSYSGTLTFKDKPPLDQPTTQLAAKAKPNAPEVVVATTKTPPPSLKAIELKLEFQGERRRLVRGSFEYLSHQYVLNGTRNERLLRVRVAPKEKDTDLATQVQAYRGVGLLHYKPADQGEGRGKIVGQIQLGRGDAKVFSTAQIELQPVIDGKRIKK